MASTCAERFEFQVIEIEVAFLQHGQLDVDAFFEFHLGEVRGGAPDVPVGGGGQADDRAVG